MSNCIEHHLPELELATSQVREALQCILHTILFIRAPGPVSPVDVFCEGFDLTYAKMAGGGRSATDVIVDEAIEKFLRRLTQIGPELLSGCLTLGFYEKRMKRNGIPMFGGWGAQEEKIVWEQWIIRTVVNNTPRPVNDDSASVIERQRIQDTAEGMVRETMLKVYEIVGKQDSLDHVPPGDYQFEIHCTNRADDQENIYARVKNMPALINLG